MRLLDTTTLKLKTFVGDEKPEYAILSHTWGDDEVLFEDLQTKSIKQWKYKAGAGKLLKSAEICAKHKIAYIWIDTCCIDKSSSSELSEAINSMFNWYLNSLICYAYLSDVLSEKVEDLQDAIYVVFCSPQYPTAYPESEQVSLNYKQLQELIAPPKVQFFDKAWSSMGGRAGLVENIHHITGIDKYVLRYIGTLSLTNSMRTCSVHTKMVWASRRTTTRAEDRAYSLMGLFNVNMPLLYGEGRVKAFQRLQDEIIKSTNDHSILLHSGEIKSGPLASSPDNFTSLHKFVKSEKRYDLTFQKTRYGIDVTLGLAPDKSCDLFWGIIAAYYGDDPSRLDRPAFRLVRSNSGIYRRQEPIIYRVRHGDEGQMEVVDETGKRIEVLQHDSVRREVVRLGSPNNSTGVEGDPIRILVRPIVHISILSRYEYHAFCPQAHGAVIYATCFYKFGLVAYVLLRNVGPDPGSPNFAILIFTSQYSEIYLHLVDIQSWPGEKGTGFDMHAFGSVDAHSSLCSVAAQISTLPIVTKKYINPSENRVYNFIQGLKEKYDQNAGTSIVMSNGVRVNAWIRQQKFFEDIVYHLHVEVDQKSTIPLKNMGKKNSSAGKPEKKGRSGWFH
ncbi:HET-domain-containing protein [Xylaria castorea]|nr:HET-domain-containing protein [Xylaria castorea]